MLTDGVHMSVDLLIWRFPKASNLIRSALTADVLHHIVEHRLLSLWTIDLETTTGNSDRTSEEAFIIALIRNEMCGNGPRARRLAHDGQLVWVSAELSTVSQ